MNKITYARKTDEGYEYGHIVIHHSGEKKERREHIPRGVCPTLDQALTANQMALKGTPRIGNAINPAFTWSEAPMNLFIKPSLRASNDVAMAV